MSDYIEKETEDLAFEHEMHSEYQDHCSICWHQEKFRSSLNKEKKERLSIGRISIADAPDPYNRDR